MRINENSSIEMYKQVGMVAGPIALQSLIGSSLNLVDNLMIGGLGETALNSVGVAVQVFFVYWMLVYGFCGGAATFISQFFGVRDMVNVRRTAGFTVAVCMGFAILFFLGSVIFPEKIIRVFTSYPQVIELGAEYLRTGAPCFLMVAVTQPLTVSLRATQQTTQPLMASVAALCVNTVLNYALIYGKLGLPELGVQGAALATVCSRTIELTLILLFVFARKNPVKGPVRDFASCSRELAGRIVRNAVPTTINETMWGLGTSMYVAAYARISVTAGAAFQACNTINNLFSMAAFSIGDAVLILVGQKLGEGKKDEAYDMTKKLLKLALVVGAVMGVFTFLFGKPILSLFEFTPEGASMAWKVLMVYAATLWLEVYGGTLVTGVLRCGGDTKFAMFTEVGTVWCIGVPVAFTTALLLHWPVYLAVLGVKLEALVKSIILTFRFFSRKWLKNVIGGLSDKS